MKRSRSDAFEDDHPSKVQRVHGQSTATQRTFLPQGCGSPYPTYDGHCADVDLRRVMDEFIAIYERLDSTDDPLVKPNYSYTELVYLALLRSHNFCLPISEIYKYIQTKFQFFRRNTREHWRNAVRHSLSKTKCFTKIGVRRGPNSSGTYNRSMFLWTFYPSSIVNFARGDYRPSVDKESGTNTLRWGYYRINAGEFWDKVSVSLENKMTSFKHGLAASPVQAQIFEHQLCILPASDSLSIDQPLSSCPEVHPAYCQPSPQSASTTLPTVSPTHAQSVAVPLASGSPALTHSNHVIPAHRPVTHCYPHHVVNQSQDSPAHCHVTYSQASHAYLHRSPSLGHPGYHYAHQGQDSPSYRATSTPMQSTPDTTSLHKSSSSASPTFSPEATPDILACAWNAVRNSGGDSESDLSWNSCHDSGVSTDFSSPDNSFLKSFIDGRQYHSPPQNVNMFSPSFNPQRYRSCHYSHTTTSLTTNSHPHDTFNDVQLLPEASLSSLFDLTSGSEHDSAVFEFLGHGQESAKHADVTSSFVTSSSDYHVSSSDSHRSSVYSSLVAASGSTAHVLSTSNLLSGSNEHGQFDFLPGFDVSTLVSIDNLASYSH